MKINLKKITEFRTIAPIIFFITIFIACRNLLNSQYFHVHDFTTGARVYELHQTLQDGQFPPRWSRNFGYGYGMPLFQFYSPLFFYLTEIFHLFNFSIISSIKLTLILTTVIGFFGSFYLSKKLTNKWGGLISAVAFTLAPYHAVNFFVRGAFAEYLAVSLIPFSIYYSFKLIDKFNKKNYLWTTIFLTAIFLSHNVTVLTFLPFYILFILYYLISNKKFKSICLIILSGINSILLSSFFLFPAFIQKKYTLADSLLTSGFSNYQFHFIYFRQLFFPNWGYGGSILGIEDDMSFYLGNEIILLSVISGILLLIKYYKNEKKQRFNLLNFIAISFLFLLSIFLSNFKSKMIWDNLPLISFIQFPWRFLGIASFFIAILASFFSLYIKNKKFVSIFILPIFILNFNFFRPEKFEPIDEFYNPNQEFIQKTMTGILPDYLPNDIEYEKFEPKENVLEFAKKENSEINISIDKTQKIKAKIKTNTENALSIYRFRFPNWEVKLDGKLIKCNTEKFYYQCKIPAGEHEIDFYWSEKGLNQISNLLSILGLALLICIYKKSKTLIFLQF